MDAFLNSYFWFLDIFVLDAFTPGYVFLGYFYRLSFRDNRKHILNFFLSLFLTKQWWLVVIEDKSLTRGKKLITNKSR